MQHDAQVHMLMEIIAKHYATIKDAAARHNLCEVTLAQLVHELLGAKCPSTQPPGVFVLDGATCDGTTVSVTGAATPDESAGEAFTGVHAFFVETGGADPDPPEPKDTPEFLDIDSVSLEAGPGADGEVWAWGVFTKPFLVGPSKVPLDAPCDM